MKTIVLILTTLSFFFVSCKKQEQKKVDYFFVGEWSASFASCQPVQDSSISIFSHVTELQLTYSPDSYGLCNWNGCVAGSGEFEAIQITENKFKLKYSTTPGNLVIIPSLDYSIDWNSFVPNYQANYDLLNSSVITVEKLSENSISITVEIANYPTKTYYWVK